VSIEGRRIAIRGVVQGVGFRPWVYRLACERGIAGRVRNDASGVTIEAFGSGPDLDAFVERLATSPPRAAAISALASEAIPAETAAGFVIEASRPEQERRVSIPPDLATCDECLADVRDSGNRRHGYPFTNCTNCGPRFTIALDVPYDRAATTMAGFRMCPACQREYDAVADRRFHAQPNACPACGPRLSVLSAPEGAPLDWPDPLAGIARALLDGRIAAIKGVGGFHLAVDATCSAAVARLRERKRRDEKPFAVMVADLEAAEALAWLDDTDRRLLSSVARPIVLVPRRKAALAPEVAPRNPLVGLMLPYTPLHHLLLSLVDRPLVMTSGNLSDEPLAIDNDEAVARLGTIADVLLVHDREIATRCDDSVARTIAGAPTLLRRARGYVPQPIGVARPFARPVLACGAHLKNAACIGVGDSAHLGPHVGDLETTSACRDFEEAVARLERFVKVRPEIVAHDLHPDYFSTAYALARPEAIKVGVQHHHAHVASAMAEHALTGPVIGIAYDGTGYGTDGTAWGGELLLAWPGTFERLASFRPLPLAGGDTAVRQCWRVALALVEDAFDGAFPLDSVPLFRNLPERDLGVVRQMLARRFHTPLARGVGRYFDAFGALFLDRPSAAYEGQIALEWNLIAEGGERGRYPFDVCAATSPPELDLRPTLRAALADLAAGRHASIISARFHNTLVAATARLVREAGRRHGRLPVVLTGGCFQNPRLAEGVRAELSREFDVRLHRAVPPGDGGIALGQAIVADAVARGAA
jgi:hydrogenase maturation protein HypF